MISLAAPCKGIQSRFRLSSNVIARLPGELHGCCCQIVKRRKTHCKKHGWMCGVDSLAIPLPDRSVRGS